MKHVEYCEWPGVLAGCLLGDGSYDGNRIRITHTDPQKSYVLAKFRLFKAMNLVTNTRLSFSQKTNLGTCMYSQVKVSLPDKRLKSLSEVELVKNLHPLGLLVWWLDAGSMSVHEKNNGTSVSRFGYLNTQSYSKQENAELSAAIESKFGIQTRIHVDKGGIKSADIIHYRLYVNATNMRKLIDVVRDYIWFVPKSMRYKLNMGYRPTRTRSSLEHTKLYNF